MQFSESINAVICRLLNIQDGQVRVANGDLRRLEELRKVGKRCENDKMVPATAGMIESIQDIQDEVQKEMYRTTEGTRRISRGAKKTLYQR